MRSATWALSILSVGLFGILFAEETIEVVVSDKVVQSKMPRIGLNVCSDPVSNRSTLLENCLNPMPGLEQGVVHRQILEATGGNGKTVRIGSIEKGAQDLPDDLWNGATFEVVFGHAAGRKGRIVERKNDTLILEEEGPAIEKGDVVRIEHGICLTARLTKSGEVQDAQNGEHAPWHGGSTCLKIENKSGIKGENVKLRSFACWGSARQGGYFGGNADRIVQEKKYRITFWAKGTAGATGSIRFEGTHAHVGDPMPDDFKLTQEWQKYELVRAGRSMNYIICHLEGGQEMYLDNFMISEDDGGTPMAILPRVMDALTDLHPGVLRLSGGTQGESLENWIAHPLERNQHVWLRACYDPLSPSLPDGLTMSERSGASPWLCMGMSMTDDEWDGLLEYLGGPPETPFGRKRRLAGRPLSWLNDFTQVYLELTYEPWSESDIWSAKNAERYGKWVERIFNRIRNSKYYSPKIRLVATGNAAEPAWNKVVLEVCKSLDILTTSCLTVGENTVDAKDSRTPSPAKLLSSPANEFLPKWTSFQKAVASAGKQPAMCSMETKSDEEGYLGPQRSLFRSLSGAVAAFDKMLICLASGCETVNFSEFAQGADNATHVDAHSMRLHSVAHAIKLFNTHVDGAALLETSIHKSGAAQMDSLPELATYAFKKDKRYKVILLNRSATNEYTVKLQLPAESKRLFCCKIAHGNPLANNLGEESVKVEEAVKDGTGTIRLPAHCILLVETEGR